MPIGRCAASGRQRLLRAPRHYGDDGYADALRRRARDPAAAQSAPAGLKRAANYYNQRYTQEGAYPKVVAADLRDDPDAGWGVGVTTKWCSNEAIVLQSLTGGGTISRLLLAGEDYGDVHGKEACPVDLTNPLPWEKPK